MAGIINSIKGTSTWKTMSFKEECETCKAIIKKDFKVVIDAIGKLRRFITTQN